MRDSDDDDDDDENGATQAQTDHIRNPHNNDEPVRRGKDGQASAGPTGEGTRRRGGQYHLNCWHGKSQHSTSLSSSWTAVGERQRPKAVVIKLVAAKTSACVLKQDATQT